jgi:hypothetical protein
VRRSERLGAAAIAGGDRHEARPGQPSWGDDAVPRDPGGTQDADPQGLRSEHVWILPDRRVSCQPRQCRPGGFLNRLVDNTPRSF